MKRWAVPTLPGFNLRSEGYSGFDVIPFVSENRFCDVLLARFHPRNEVPPEVFGVQHLLKLGGLHREQPVLSGRELERCFFAHVAVRMGEAVLGQPDTVPRGVSANYVSWR